MNANQISFNFQSNDSESKVTNLPSHERISNEKQKNNETLMTNEIMAKENSNETTAVIISETDAPPVFIPRRLSITDDSIMLIHQGETIYFSSFQVTQKIC